MYLFGKRVDEIVANDIVRLVESKVQETRSLDYKLELKLSQDKDRKEFLYDITSLANTDGGCLIYGIEESKDEKGQNTGSPLAVKGITIDNYDKLVQQIEDIIKGNTDPPVSNIYVKEVSIGPFKMLIIGVAKTFGLPVMVTFNETNKFYKRRNSGKYAVDVYELNHLFMQNVVLKQNAQQFRIRRIDEVRNLAILPNIENFPSLFLHIIPFSFLSDKLVDLSNLENEEKTKLMKPMSPQSGWNFMYNADGFAAYSTGRVENKIYAYDQIFRNGIYEAYTASFLYPADQGGQKFMFLYGKEFVKNVLTKITSAFELLKYFEIEPPFFISLSFYGLQNSRINDNYNISNEFVRTELHLPQIVIPQYESKIYEHLKPILDILWQAAGIPNSPLYFN